LNSDNRVFKTLENNDNAYNTIKFIVLGSIEVNPSYGFGSGVKIAYKTTIGGKEDSKTFPETDHFGGETEYFSECVLKNIDPEADGEDGFNDVRVIVAIKESLKGNGNTVKLDTKDRSKRATLDQAKTLSLAKEPKVLVGRDSQKPGAN
jgi:predicted dehydrogenase